MYVDLPLYTLQYDRDAKHFTHSTGLAILMLALVILQQLRCQITILTFNCNTVPSLALTITC